MSLQRAAEVKLRVMLNHWAAALAREIAEHGTPNSFGVVELAGKYQRLVKRDGYRIGTQRLGWLKNWLEAAGYKGPLAYKSGRFYLDTPEEDIPRG